LFGIRIIIAFNNYNNCADADTINMMRLRIFKSESRILQLWIIQKTASASTPLIFLYYLNIVLNQY
jgi:tryptophan synthase alpha subunit